MNENAKIYAVLFQFSPNGRNDQGEFRAEVADGKFYLTKDAACRAVKAKFDELMEKERVKGYELDPEWAEQLTPDEIAACGYSWEPDFSRFGYERESQYADVPAEPKYSWTVVEMERSD